MRGQPPISRVYQMGEPSPRDPHQAFELRKAMWRALGLVVIDPADDDVGDWLREAVRAYARKRYGGLR
jgi:hypothetical protein